MPEAVAQTTLIQAHIHACADAHLHAGTESSSGGLTAFGKVLGREAQINTRSATEPTRVSL